MPVGFISYGDAGFVQIDDTNTVNLSLVKKGWLTLTTSIPGPYSYSRTVKYGDIELPTATTSTPFVALRAESHYELGGWGVAGTYTSGANTYIRCAADKASTAGGNWTLKYWVFDRPPVAPSGFGMEIYDANSKLKFSSMYENIPIVGNGAGTYPTGRTYATATSCFLDASYEYDLSAGTVDSTYYFNGARINNNVISVYSSEIAYQNGSTENQFPEKFGIGNGSAEGLGTSGMVVLDMTGWGLIGDAPPIA
jgi:hypothetical protein